MSPAAIYVVANKRSQQDLASLIYSIRSSGCTLDIVLLPFGGQPVSSSEILSEVKQLPLHSFSVEAQALVSQLQQLLKCPQGFLYRFLAFYGPYEKFIYSDNDIVALSNWDYLIDRLDDHDLVHADEEYTTMSKYNFHSPAVLENDFGISAHEKAITAGHFAASRKQIFLDSLVEALDWMEAHAAACKLHDQTLMQVASIIGKWNCLNLCKTPYNYLSSWAGDYKNALDLIHKIQSGFKITHLHYSGGGTGSLVNPVEELMLSRFSPRERLALNTIAGLKSLSGLNYSRLLSKKISRKLKTLGI